MSSSAVSFTTSLPLMSSSPMLRRPTVGRSTWSTADTSAVPITANCSSCSGEQLTLAPRSSTVVTPLRVGSCEAIAGRSTPGSVFRTKREIAIRAPVLPAETQASARPSFTRLIATRIDESFFRRSASAGGSCISTTSDAGSTARRDFAGDLIFPRTAASGSGRPTAMTRASGCAVRKSIAAGSVTEGPWSPPIASTATVIGMSAWPSSECGPASRTDAPATQVDQQGGGTGGTARAGRRDAAPSAATPRGARTGRYSSALVLTTFLPR